MLMNILDNVLMLLSFLSVVGIRAMLAVVMFLNQKGIHGCFWVERE